MFEKMEWSFHKLLSWIGFKNKLDNGKEHMKIIRKGSAMRVIFFYPGEEGTYVDHADVTLYENGIVNICSNQEETTTHLQNCEILWRFETDAEDRANKVRLLKPKAEPRTVEDGPTKVDSKLETKSGKGSPSKNPEAVE